MLTKLKNFLNQLYQELSSAHETPHRVSMSFAIGVFLGILPFTGVIAAIAVAWFFRLNKAAAIIGSAITNTWLGFIVFGFSVNIGSVFTGSDSKALQQQIQILFKNFSWRNLQEVDFLPILCSVAIGYVILSFMCALIGYLFALTVIHWHRKER